MNITAAGIGSGLDLESIIKVFVESEAVPMEIRLQNKQDRLSTELSGVGQFKSALSNFESVLKKLNEVDDFNKQNTEVSSDAISVATNGLASNGSFEVEVMQLAKGSRLESTTFSAPTDTVGSGTLTFGAGADSFDVIIDPADSLSAIRDKVNEEAANFGVVANVITTDAGSFLSFTSEKTGAANSLSITTSDASLDAISTNATLAVAAQDAIIQLDGNTVTKESNEFKNVVEDVTITVNKTNVGNPATFTLSQDDENGKKLVEEFVASYNALVGTLDYLGNAETGLLAFDANIRSVKQQMTSIVTDTVGGVSGSLESLNDIGVSLNRNGLLEISPTSIGTLPSGVERLDDTLSTKLNEVGEVFASTDGVATKLLTLFDSYNGTDGTLSQRKTALSKELSGIQDEYTALETRLRDYEDTLRSRFSFLDATVSRYNATSQWLTANLSSLTQGKDD